MGTAQPLILIGVVFHDLCLNVPRIVYIGELQPYCNFCEPFLILKTHVNPHLSAFSLPLVLMSNWLPLDAWFSVSDLRVKNPYY
jgi:hypothetical protein